MDAQLRPSVDEALPRVGREAALAGLITLALTATMVGLHTVPGEQSRLTLEFRFPEVIMAVVLVFFGRLGLSFTREGFGTYGLAIGIVIALGSLFFPGLASIVQILGVGAGAIVAINALWKIARPVRPDRPLPKSSAQMMDDVAAWVQRKSVPIGGAGIVFAIALPWLFPDRSSVDLATLVMTYIMLGWGLNIIVGLAGLLDLGYVAFYAVGAYSYGLLAQYFDFSFWLCLPLAGILAAFAGLILGFPVLRLRGDYFAIVTLGFGEIIRVVLQNWSTFTGGPDGIASIPRPSFFGIAEFTSAPEADGLPSFHTLFGLEFTPLHRLIFLYYLILVLALIVNAVSLRVRKLPLGRSWEALREDDVACQSLGINRRNIKLAAFTISAMFGGFAGSFFATRQGFISPESFTFIESAIVLAIVVLGGMGSQTGVVLAAILIIGLPELFRELEEYRMLIFGAAMVIIMVWRPRGLLAHREPTVRLHGRHGPKAPPKGGQAQEVAAE
ncbi:MAG: high-affinity branched-chain amino acid ABC transporter permease LivM [Pseudomonadota bacterium]